MIPASKRQRRTEPLEVPSAPDDPAWFVAEANEKDFEDFLAIAPKFDDFAAWVNAGGSPPSKRSQIQTHFLTKASS
jgi:hypothetical protein